MAYQYPPPGQLPYGSPSPHLPYGAPNGYQQAPQGYPPPGAPPSVYAPNGYQQSPQGYAPQNNNPYPPQAPPQGYPPQYGYQQPPQAYAATPPPQIYSAPQGYPTPPSLGYGPPQQIPYNPDQDADALRKAMKGFGTDEKMLIAILADKDPLQINLIRQSYNYRHKRNLEADIKSETSKYFEEGLCALVRGPLLQDCHILYTAMKGLGTKESDLNDVLLSRSNADIRAIKATYQTTYGRSLESDLKGDLSMKTERHFLMVVAANRAEDYIQPNPQQVDQDVLELYKAMEGKVGTDELLVCSILTERNNAQIRAISYAYEQRFRKSLKSVIRSVSQHTPRQMMQKTENANP